MWAGFCAPKNRKENTISRVNDLWWATDKDTGKKVKTTRHGKGLRWLAVWTNGRGTEVKKSHRTKDAAGIWIQDQDAQHRAGYTPGGPKLTVAEAGEAWIKAQLDWEPKSRHTARQIWDKTIMPVFGGTLLEQVTRQQVRDWLYDMSTKYTMNTVEPIMAGSEHSCCGAPTRNMFLGHPRMGSKRQREETEVPLPYPVQLECLYDTLAR